jgi:hypothetical protein
MPSEKVAAIDRRAADSGLDRTKHLLGRFRSRGSSNAQVRAALCAQGETTVDRKDFSVYRRHGRRPVRCIFPD